MAEKPLPCTDETLIDICNRFPTPFHLYDEKGIVENMSRLKSAFSWSEGFTEFFAVKAAPNPFLVTLLKNIGAGADCSSLSELILSEKCGITGERIMFSSNDTPAAEFKKARELGAVINLDDISHIPYLEKHAGIPDVISQRFNPGPERVGNDIIGHPEDAKFGYTRSQIIEGYRLLKEKGASRFGLHTMVISNELNPDYFIDTAIMLFELAVEVQRETGIRLEFVNLGGGVGIPYRLEQKAVDLEYVSRGIKDAYERIVAPAGLHPLKIFLECGRMITGPYGYLVTRVEHIKKTYKNYAGLDSSMADLMRPALYGAYHHITVVGKPPLSTDVKYDVTGSLCENNDKFAIDRVLPELDEGDLLVIHDAGAHGHAMGFNYNGKLRSAELLLRSNGDILQIRRAETIDDYFATLDFTKLATFS